MKKEFTRREFIKTAGKGLSLLALFSGVVRFDAPAKAAEGEMLFANDLLRGEDQLKVIFLDKKHEEKSDCFIIMYLSQSGLDIILHDGGFDDGHSYTALGNLRREILEKANIPTAEQGKYRLNLKLVISHFHTDHVQALNGTILMSKRFAVTEAYIPQKTCLVQGVYDDNENSDLRERVAFLYMMKTYHPDAMIRVLDWGETCLVPTEIGKVQLFAQTEDWGKEEKLGMFKTNYGYKGRYNEGEAIPICVLNANCLWMRVALSDHSFLFTGDVEKRITVRRDEPLDHFIDAYGEDLRSDVIKYPHHGQMRAAAAGSIKRSLITQKEEAICILTASDGKDDAGYALNRLNMPWLDLESGSLFFTVKDGKLTRETVQKAKSFL
ncbi:MAG: hypothetical protein IKW00_02200 [Clostridia bacterium]|nr:hypothetical protein [Clostridia bacterium]